MRRKMISEFGSDSIWINFVFCLSIRPPLPFTTELHQHFEIVEKDEMRHLQTMQLIVTDVKANHRHVWTRNVRSDVLSRSTAAAARNDKHFDMFRLMEKINAGRSDSLKVLVILGFVALQVAINHHHQSIILSQNWKSWLDLNERAARTVEL